MGNALIDPGINFTFHPSAGSLAKLNLGGEVSRADEVVELAVGQTDFVEDLRFPKNADGGRFRISHIKHLWL